MGRIALLPVALANQIAAGEVVERPASVVKELVENALDAGARHVTIAVRGGGCAGILVRDDGEGMSRDDAVLAFARHATSKIRMSEDLIAIGTFGFRGEALASIAAAADVELVTRRAEEDAGTRVRTHAGVVSEVAAAGCPPGTQVQVQALFAALPARRKFLKRPATEFGHVAEAVSRLALGAPHVGVALDHDGRRALDLPPVAGPAERLIEVLGRETAAGIVGLEARGQAITVRAYLGRPDHSLASARLVLTYVDGRCVRDRLLTRAVLDGYASLLMRGRYPVAVVFLEMPPGDVDVNVHPAKAEVRFREAGEVYRFLTRSIAGRLREALPLPGAAPPAPVGGGVGWSSERPRRGGAAPAAWPAAPWPPAGETDVRGPAAVRESGPAYAGATGAPAGGEAVQGAAERVDGGAVADRRGGFASLRVLGQVLDGYLVCASPRGLVLIDQHAAHERVRFERLRAQAGAGRVAAQRLLVPETLRLGARDVRALDGASDILGRLGFEGDVFGEETFVIRAVPALLADADCGRVLRDLAAEVGELGAGRAGEDAVDAVLARVACHSAIRVGRRLETAEIEALLRAMDDVAPSGYCPHGRPAYVEIDARALEHLFKR
jgi:DNA mismatch repair protein MutL